MTAPTRRSWRSLEELARNTRGVAPSRGGEFAPGAASPPDEMSRRQALKWMAASLAMTGAAGCTRAPRGKIVPYTTQPPEVTPGVASHYATAIAVHGYAVGLLVESHEGRPTKIEGNPHHPASLGGAGSTHLASILSLYDPNRARAVRERGKQRGWLALFGALCADGCKRRYVGEGRGAGLHFLLPPTGSPLVARGIDRVRARFPKAQMHFQGGFGPSAAHVATKALYGDSLETQIAFDAADVVVALDADFLAEGPSFLRAARQFVQRRKVRSTADGMNRLYVVEPGLTVTGGFADHRFRARRSEIPMLAAALLGEVLSQSADSPATFAVVRDRWKDVASARPWIAKVARDLLAARGRVAIVVGEGQGVETHAVAHVLHRVLGSIGVAVTYTRSSILEAGEESHELSRLVEALDAGEVDTLVTLGGNPVHGAPADLALGERFKKATERVYLGLHEDETAQASTWFVGAAHYLESWGDERAHDGTASIVQPLIEPLYAGRTTAEVLAAFAGEKLPRAHDLLRGHFAAAYAIGGDAEDAWERALSKGVVEGSRADAIAVTLDEGAAVKLLDRIGASTDEGLELAFVFDSKIQGGALANVPWLLELPDPITKLTWENAALISPTTARAMGLDTHDEVELAVDGRTVRAPVMIVPGNADETVIVPLGWGRLGAESIARGLGFDGHTLRTSSSPKWARGATMRKVGTRPLAITQEHGTLEGRDLVRHATLDEYRENPGFAKDPGEPRAALYKLPLAPGASPLGRAPEQWAMSIDLHACTGCSACVIACQAENNIPVVGKAGVQMSREMHWLRIDRYFEGTAEDPQVRVEPMMCQHCESAPCEYVCPVNATVHSPDGINEQVYNRCVGTRFCSNNCAWKVRRFNWFDYQARAVKGQTAEEQELHAMAMNPDVTVRARGVMEKCTFCVQRVREAGIRARIGEEGERPLVEGDVTTACAQACPTEAIVFGSLTWAGAEVNVRRENERAFEVLGELGTRPRVRYLARLSNPNPELDE